MLANILAVGLMASVMSFSPRYVVDNQNETITFSAKELNNNTYTYLAEQLNKLDGSDLPTELTNTTITYNENTYEFDELVVNNTLNYTYTDTNNENYEIFLVLNENDTVYGKWVYNTPEIDVPFTASMTINNAEWFIDNINAPLDSGDMMTAITSGLPLMASLAQAFLNGFTSIFWNSTTNTLTTFSNFALIILSISVVFACIKLVLNLIRSNTGV